MSAGQLFICVCCGDEGDEALASLDRDLNGPVCPECQHALVLAEVGLRRLATRKKGEIEAKRLFTTCTQKFNNRIHEQNL